MTPSITSFEILLHAIFEERLKKTFNKRRDSNLQKQLDQALKQLSRHPFSSNANRRLADFPLQNKQGMVYLITRVGGRSGHRLYYGLFEQKKRILLYHLSIVRKDVATERRNLNLLPIVRAINTDYFEENYSQFNYWAAH